MAGPSFEEVLRIVLETKGQEGVEALRKAVGDFGDVSDETVDETGRLIDSLVELNSAAGKASRLGQMYDDLARTSSAFDSAQQSAYQLALQLGDLATRNEALQAERSAATREVERLAAAMQAEGDSVEGLEASYRAAQEQVKRLTSEINGNEKEMRILGNAQKSSRAEMEKLEGTYDRQWRALDKLDKELASAGHDTTDLARLQGKLAGEMSDVTVSVERQSRAVASESKAMADLKARLAAGDEAFRRFTNANNTSAQALEAYRQRAGDAARNTRDLGGAAESTSGILSKMRGFLAPLAALLTFRSAATGVKELANVAMAAEDARRALGEMYGSVSEGMRVYGALEDIAKRNGLAIDDMVAAAQKLKAFGIDPLNGSLQAFIDQNAAVGGSVQDLDGKLLALGQAWAKQKLQGEEILQLVERGVPVWDLLQKATGRNVEELNKLSSAGQLGRDVIQQLWEAVASENAGAAERSLGSMSGLIAQMEARWVSFKQRVADAGVADYLREQFKAILDSTTNVDEIAKRVGAGIVQLLDTVKSIGQIAVPVVSTLARMAEVLANNAKAVVLLGTAWTTLRFATWAQGFAGLTLQITRTTQALAAQRAAMALMGTTGVNGVFGAMGAAIAGVTTKVTALVTVLARVTRVAGIPAAAITSVVYLANAYEKVHAELLKLETQEARLRQMQRDGVQLGQQLQGLYAQYADTIVKSNEDISRLTKAQAEDYLYALENARQYYRGLGVEAINAGKGLDAGVTAALDRIAESSDNARKHIDQLNSAAARRNAVAMMAIDAVEKFDVLISQAKTAREAVGGIFDNVDFTRSEGVRQAADIVGQVAIRGRDAGKAIREELSAALMKVSVDDLPRLKMEAEAAMAAGVRGAQEFSDAVASVNLQRLGVDIQAIKTGFTEAGRTAVEAFKGAVKEVDSLGLTVEQRSTAISKAFDNAFRQATTKAELQSLKVALQEAFASGDIALVEFRARLDEVDARLLEVSGTGAKIGDGVAQGAQVANSALDGVAQHAAVAADGLNKTAQSAAQAGDAAAAGANGANTMSFALRKMSDAAIESLMYLNKFASNRDIWISMWNDQMAAIDEQYAALKRLNDELDRQLSKDDPVLKRLEKLRLEYSYADEATLLELAQKQVQLDEKKAERREAKLQAEREALEAETAAVEKSESAGITQRSVAEARAATTAATELISSAAQAATAISSASASMTDEIILRVIAEIPANGMPIALTQQQLNEIASAVTRLINNARSLST